VRPEEKMAEEIFEDRLQESFEKKGIADRSYTRVAVAFPIRFMPVSKEEAQRLLPEYAAQPTRERMEAGLPLAGGGQHAAPGTVSAAILAQLERIERKLDQVLSASGMSAEKGGEVSFETGQCIDLSGSGLLFTSRWAMSKGWFLKLVIETPEPQAMNVVALGRVVRIEQEAESSLYVTAVHFESIHEEDREELIGFIFKRHREIAQHRRDQD